MIIARQSTARTVMIGPVLDASGVAVTDCVVADFKISKLGAAPAALNGSAVLTARHTGFYSLALTASDLDTVGQAEITIDDTVNSCAMKEITVVVAAVYDALFASTANGFSGAAGSSTVTFSNTSIATVTNLTNAPTAGDFTATMKTSIGTAVAASAVASVTGNVGGNVGGSVGSVATGGIVAASFAAGAITASAIGTDAFTASKFAADVTTELQAGLATQASVDTIAGYLDTEVAAIKAVTDRLDTALVLDGSVYQFTANALELAPTGGGGGLDAAGVRAAVGLASANLDTQLGAIDDFLDTEVAAIKAKTDGLPSDPADASDIAASFATVNTALGTIAGYLDTEVAAIKAQTDLIPASPAAVGDAMTLSSGERSAVADALLGRNVAGGSSTGRTVSQTLYAIRNKWDNVNGTYTVYETDDTTVSWTATISGTSAGGADVITGSDPA